MYTFYPLIRTHRTDRRRCQNNRAKLKCGGADWVTTCCKYPCFEYLNSQKVDFYNSGVHSPINYLSPKYAETKKTVNCKLHTPWRWLWRRNRRAWHAPAIGLGGIVSKSAPNLSKILARRQYFSVSNSSLFKSHQKYAIHNSTEKQIRGWFTNPILHWKIVLIGNRQLCSTRTVFIAF